MGKQSRVTLKAIDLFSGCGGLTLGLKQAGFDVVGAVEIESLAAETYRTNHPEVELWEKDIRDISAREILSRLNMKLGELDLLAGCPPCQGFSSMRTMNGGKRVRDARNDLVFDFLKLVKGLRPKAVMMENVPALAENRRMKTFVKELHSLGYEAGESPKVLNVAAYGVPQRRRRMILMASLKGPVPFADPLDGRVTVRAAIGSMPKAGTSGDPLHDYPEKRSEKVMRLISRVPKDGGNRQAAGARYQLECHKRCDGFKDVYGRMAWDEVSPTMTSGCTNPSKGRFIHPEENRAITLREAALLQTFPPDYFFSLRRGKQSAALLIGNALPPEFIRRQAESIAVKLAS